MTTRTNPNQQPEVHAQFTPQATAGEIAEEAKQLYSKAIEEACTCYSDPDGVCRHCSDWSRAERLVEQLGAALTAERQLREAAERERDEAYGKGVSAGKRRENLRFLRGLVAKFP